MIRGILALGTGVVASLVAAWVLPSTQSGPLRATLIAAPMVIAALALIAGWAHEHGGPATPRKVVALEWTLSALLLVLAIGFPHFGLAPTGKKTPLVIFAAIALLLMHRVARIVYALARTTGERLPSRPAWPFFMLPLVVYLAILPWSLAQHPPDGDEPHYLLLTHSLAFDLDTDLADNYAADDSLRFIDRRLEPQLGDPVGQGGELYSRHNMLLPLVLAPAYRLFGVLGAVVVMAAITATVCWLLLSLASHYFPDRPRESVAAYAILAFTAPLILFSYQIWVEVPAALLSLIALDQIHRVGRSSSGRTGGWLMLVLALLLLPLLKLRFLLISVALVVLMSIRCEPAVRKRVLLLIAALAVLGPAILLFNHGIFQNPLKYHDIDGLKPYVLPIGHYLRGLVGLAFDCAFGLFAFAPIWLLLVPAFVLLIWRRSRLLIDFVVVFSPYLALLAPRGEWFGAWSPPFRYGIVMLPVLALWLVPLLARRDRAGARGLIAALTASTVALALLWLVEPGWTYNLAHGRSHILDLLAIDTGTDLARFFPSSTRMRAATWIWPPAALVLSLLLWWLPARRLAKPVTWGLIASLLLVAAVPVAARSRATRVVEFEDPWIEKHSGSLYPEVWVIYRPRFRGGWMLTANQSLTVPLVAGGERFDLDIELRNRRDLPNAGVLELSEPGGRVLATRKLSGEDRWQRITFSGLPRPQQDRLTITLLPPRVGNTHSLLDRAALRWH